MRDQASLVFLIVAFQLRWLGPNELGSPAYVGKAELYDAGGGLEGGYGWAGKRHRPDGKYQAKMAEESRRLGFLKYGNYFCRWN